MKNLLTFLTETLNSEFIIKSAEKFNSLSDLFNKVGFSKRRHSELAAACKKVLGNGPYYAISDDNAKDAYNAIANEADLSISKSGFQDLIDLNVILKDKDASTVERKLEIKNTLYRNKELKRLGLTDQLDTELKKMNDLLSQDPITLNKNLNVKTGDGTAVMNVYPVVCIVDEKLVTGVQFTSDVYLSKGMKFLYVFSESSLS